MPPHIAQMTPVHMQAMHGQPPPPHGQQLLQHPQQPPQLQQQPPPQLAQHPGAGGVVTVPGDLSDQQKNQTVSMHPDDAQAHQQLMSAAAAAAGYHPSMNGHGLHHPSMAGMGPLDSFEIPLDHSSQGGGHPQGFDSPYNGVNAHMVHPHQPPPSVLPPFDQQQVRVPFFCDI